MHRQLGAVPLVTPPPSPSGRIDQREAAALQKMRPVTNDSSGLDTRENVRSIYDNGRGFHEAEHPDPSL